MPTGWSRRAIAQTAITPHESSEDPPQLTRRDHDVLGTMSKVQLTATSPPRKSSNSHVWICGRFLLDPVSDVGDHVVPAVVVHDFVRASMACAPQMVPTSYRPPVNRPAG